MPLAVLVPERGGGCGDDRPEVGNIASRDRSKPRCRAFLKRFFRGGVDDIVVEEVGKPHSTRPLSWARKCTHETQSSNLSSISSLTCRTWMTSERATEVEFQTTF